jgi:hypothetical protein
VCDLKPFTLPPQQVYHHNVGKAIELMIAEALVLADPVLKISDAAADPAAYMGLSTVLSALLCDLLCLRQSISFLFFF